MLLLRFNPLTHFIPLAWYEISVAFLSSFVKYVNIHNINIVQQSKFILVITYTENIDCNNSS